MEQDYFDKLKAMKYCICPNPLPTLKFGKVWTKIYVYIKGETDFLIPHEDMDPKDKILFTLESRLKYNFLVIGEMLKLSEPKYLENTKKRIQKKLKKKGIIVKLD